VAASRIVARRLALALGALTAAACGAEKAREAAGLGRQVFAGQVRALHPSPDGATLAFLEGCADVRVQFLPPQTGRCDLRVVAAAGGEAAKVAAGVTTLPHGVAWRSDGKLLVALADYDHASASGALVAWRGGEAHPLGDGVTFHGFGAHGELGLVAGGKLAVMLPDDASPHRIEGADQVASFEFSRHLRGGWLGGEGAVCLVARRTYASGGQLLVAGCDLKEARPLERGQVGEYGFARTSPSFAYVVKRGDGGALRLASGAWPPVTHDLAQRAGTFAFAPDGRVLAFVAGVAPGKQGDLHLGGTGTKATLLAREVGEFRWATDAPRLAWLERYDPRVRSGVLGAGGPGMAPRTIAQNVSEFDLSPGGRQVAFLQHTARGGYSVDLGLARLDAPNEQRPATLAQGVFGFAFSPDGRWLYYRTRCVRNAEACDLERVPSDGLAPGAKPEPVAQGVKSFEFDPHDPGRLLLGWQRMDMVALDIGLWQDGKLTRVDSAVLPGTARFLGPDSRRIAYVVAHPKRAGVYVAEAPR
jgi:hypothetical protein